MNSFMPSDRLVCPAWRLQQPHVNPRISKVSRELIGIRLRTSGAVWPFEVALVKPSLTVGQQ